MPFRGRIAPVQDELANVFRIEETAFVQTPACPAGRRKDCPRAPAGFARRRIFVEQPFNDLPRGQSRLLTISLRLPRAPWYRESRPERPRPADPSGKSPGSRSWRAGPRRSGGFGPKFEDNTQAGSIAISLLNCSKTFIAPLAMHPVPAQETTSSDASLA
jgi:hypothetical protein